MIALLLFTAGYIVGVAVEYAADRCEQLQLVQEIQSKGGHVVFDVEQESRLLVKEGIRSAVGDLRVLTQDDSLLREFAHRIGPNWIGRPRWVFLGGDKCGRKSAVNDQLLLLCGRLKQLDGIDLVEDDCEVFDYPVTDDGIRELVRLAPQLRWLDLSYSRISSTSIAHLKELKHLNHLDLDHTAIDREAIWALNTMPALEYLDLNETSITDDEIAQLKSGRHLNFLSCAGGNVTQKGVSALEASFPRALVIGNDGFSSAISRRAQRLSVKAP